MLKDNNYHNSDCGFAEQMVSYIYDECSTGDKVIFEEHLAKCKVCSADLAGFNLSHFSILEWKKEEFSSLQTPKIEIPFEYFENPVSKNPDLPKAETWYALFVNKFSRLSFPAAAFASLLILTGLFLFVYKFSSNDAVSSSNGQKSTAENIALISENSNNSELPNDSLSGKNITPDKSILNSAGSDFNKVPALKTLKLKDKKRASKSSNDSAQFSVRSEFASQNSKYKSTSRKIYNSVFVSKVENKLVRVRKIPNLNSIEEDDEANNLRLSDLLEAVNDK
jgi:hypothetical protein